MFAGDWKNVHFEFDEGHKFSDLFYANELSQTLGKHHISLLQIMGTKLLKIYVNNGTLKTTLDNTYRNCRAAYENNTNLFPRTERVATGNVRDDDNKKYDFIVIEQDYLEEAEGGTLDNYLEDDWNLTALDIVLDKYDDLQSREQTKIKTPKIRTWEGFVDHEKDWEKRFCLPTLHFTVDKLKKEGEEYLSEIDLEKIKIPETTKISRITREFAPRNLLVEGNMLTFDTELYGLGRRELDFAVMTSQLLLDKKGHEKQFIDHIANRYSRKVAEGAMEEFIAYRSSSLFRDLKGIGTDRTEYNRKQLQQAIKLWNYAKSLK